MSDIANAIAGSVALLSTAWVLVALIKSDRFR